jgi:hypothetical protein
MALVSAAWGQTPDTTVILEKARDVALNYSKNLPNFTCNEIISRYDDYTGRSAWTAVDKLTLEVRFSGREDYRLIARNGKPTEMTLEEISGTLTRGEFGSALVLMFQPSSGAEFQWHRWEMVHGRRLAEFTFRVSAEKSKYELRVYRRSVTAGYHGTVSILPATGEVFRWAMEADVPSDFPITKSSVKMEYDCRKIDATEYLLPVRAEMHSSEPAGRRTVQHQNLVEFQNYRKFGVESTVTFK